MSKKIGFIEISLAASNPKLISSGLDALIASKEKLELKTVVFVRDIKSYKNPLIERYVDEWVVCDTSNEDTIYEYAKNMSLDALISFSDLFVGIASRVANRLGLKAPNYKSSVLSRDKAQVRKDLDTAGIRNLQWNEIDCNKPFVDVSLDFPFIAKPVDGASSWDVQRVDNKDQLREMIESHKKRSTYGRGISPKHKVIVEEEMLGELISIEGFINEEGIDFWGFTGRTLSEPPYYYEITATFRENIENSNLFKEYCEQVIKATDYTFGPFHIEIMSTETGPVLIEFNPRLLGGGGHTLINVVKQTDITEHIINQYLENNTKLSSRNFENNANAATLRIIYLNAQGDMEEIKGLDNVNSHRYVEIVQISKDKSDKITKPKSNGDAIGYIIATGINEKESYEHSTIAIKRMEVFINNGNRKEKCELIL